MFKNAISEKVLYAYGPSISENRVATFNAIWSCMAGSFWTGDPVRTDLMEDGYNIVEFAGLRTRPDRFHNISLVLSGSPTQSAG